MEIHAMHGLLLFALATEGVKKYLQQLLSEEDRWLYSKRPILNCGVNSSHTERLTGSGLQAAQVPLHALPPAGASISREEWYANLLRALALHSERRPILLKDLCCSLALLGAALAGVPFSLLPESSLT